MRPAWERGAHAGRAATRLGRRAPQRRAVDGRVSEQERGAPARTVGQLVPSALDFGHTSSGAPALGTTPKQATTHSFRGRPQRSEDGRLEGVGGPQARRREASRTSAVLLREQRVSTSSSCESAAAS
jgi:hypothetical protein